MNGEGNQRHLSAILAADIVGYTRLMEQDTEGTVAAWKAARSDIIDPTIAGHYGRIVKHTGDGFLVEFQSALDAVKCAIAIQVELAQSPLDFRMGINLGDIIDDGEDIHGEGVNIAARIEALADSGGICISSGIYDQIRNQLDHQFEDVGEHTVKHVSTPVHVYRVVVGHLPTGRAGSTPKLPDKPSIAVLPFDNMSSDPEQEFFADGVTEDIITALSKFRSFFVSARNSTFVYKGQVADIKQVGRDMGVRYILEGSVRKAGSRIRISAQLIEAETGNNIWAERYDGDLDDIFELQDDITQRVAAGLKPELERAELQRLRSGRKTDVTAWNLYLQGLWHSYKHTLNDNRRALELLQQAYEADDEFSQAYAAAAYVKFNDVLDGYTDRPKDTLQEAFELAEKAVSEDSQDAYAHFVLGRICSLKLDFEQSISELEFAIKLNPSLADAYHGLGFVLTYSGRPEESIEIFKMAYKLSPHDANVWAFFGIRAVAYIEMREYDEAIRCAREAVHRRYAKYWAFSHLVSALGHGGTTQEAEKAITELLDRKPDFTVSFAKDHLYYYRHPEQLEHYLKGLRMAGLPE